MRSPLPAVAREIKADERTLRRAVELGAIRCRRPGPRRLELAEGELDYLRTHWGLVRALTGVLRTEPSVRLAVLYGSMARGDDRRDSDVDLLVELNPDASAAARDLAVRLERALSRDVDVARLDRARESAPLLVLQALEEGRVLVDRDECWRSLRRERDRIESSAISAHEASREQAASAFNELMEQI
jgi:predicted nucleotidyltransferase